MLSWGLLIFSCLILPFIRFCQFHVIRASILGLAKPCNPESMQAMNLSILEDRTPNNLFELRFWRLPKALGKQSPCSSSLLAILNPTKADVKLMLASATFAGNFQPESGGYDKCGWCSWHSAPFCLCKISGALLPRALSLFANGQMATFFQSTSDLRVVARALAGQGALDKCSASLAKRTALFLSPEHRPVACSARIFQAALLPAWNFRMQPMSLPPCRHRLCHGRALMAHGPTLCR